MEKKKELIRKRRSYYDDYKKTASGEYIYAGPVYEFIGGEGKTRSAWMRSILLMSIVAFILQFPSGFMFVPGLNGCGYVVLPYGAGIIAGIYLLIITVCLAAAKDNVKAWEYDRSVKVLPTVTVLMLVIGAANVICETVYVILNGAGGRWLEFAVYLVCNIISAVLSYFMYRLVKSVEWKVKRTEAI